MENLKGIMLMVVSMAGFAFEDAVIKYSADYLPSGQIILLLGLFGSLIFAAMVKANGHRLVSRAFLARAVILRNLCEMASAIFFISALVLIPLSTASAILQATPLAVTLGAAAFLGAQVGWRRWSAILVGLAGVLLIIRPGAEGFMPASLLAVAGVIALAGRDLATRAAPAGIPSLVLAFYGFVAAMMAGLLLLALQREWAPLPPWLLGLLLGTAVVAVASYYAVVAAMRIGDIAVVTPFRYARILFALILGAVVFGESLDGWTFAGTAVVIGSGLYTILREARLRRTARREVAPGEER